MASIRIEPKSGVYFVQFRYGRRQFNRSLKTRDEREALAIRGSVERTLLDLERGRLEMPPGADPAMFILTDGKLANKTVLSRERTLGEVCDEYLSSIPEGSKAPTTLYGERIHISHLKRVFGVSKVFRLIDAAAVQGYIDKRSSQKYRGKRISGDTIHKELVTFRQIWQWANGRGIVQGSAPLKGSRLPKREDKPPFRSWLEIEAVIAREKPGNELELWKGLFLTTREIGELLEHVKANARHPWIYPMFAFAAWTGARRSEILRSLVSDWDFGSKTVTLREKKQVHSRSLSYRSIPIHSALEAVMQDWFSRHPGGSFAITASGEPVTRDEAVHHFKATLENSKWKVIPGFHVLRHSFASNLAAAGIDQVIIDRLMGHQTEEQRRRYRHLFPGERMRTVNVLLPSLDAALDGK